ncbi:major facilitator superfamily domain-containing protein [Mortierella sp. GBAus27b]|nr:major facilitator superfamily domain-containing protein [Mortierella sp. GBAus27b]
MADTPTWGRSGGATSRTAEANETTPLISPPPPPSYDTPPSPTPAEKVDPTAIYVQILKEHLPWYKRPSAFWLFPIYCMAAISGGMLMSTTGQFRAALLCQEYLSRHAPSDSTNFATDMGTNMSSQVTNFIFQAVSNSATTMFSGGSEDVFGLGIVRPGPECKTPEIQAYTAKMMALIDVLMNVAAVLSIGYYASFSDKHGRVKIMSLGFINTTTMLIGLYIMGTWWDIVGFPFMALVSLVHGLLGGPFMGSMMCLVYAADCTDPKRRSLVYSWLHAGLFFGLALGPYLGGAIAKATDNFLTVVYIDLAASVFSLLLLLFTLPESLPAKQSAHIRKLYEEALESKRQHNQEEVVHKKSTQETTSLFGHISRSLQFFKPGGQNTNLILLAAITFLQMLGLKGSISVIILYTNRVFNWTEYEDGILFSLSSSIRLLALMGGLPILVHVYHKLTKKQEGPKGNGKNVDHGNNGRDTANAADRTDNDALVEGAGNGLLVGIEDPYVASSVEHLGKEALNLSGDEGSSKERRRRRSTAGTSKTWDSQQTMLPSPSSSHPPGSFSKNPSSSSPPTGTTSGASQTEAKPTGDMEFDIWMIRLGYTLTSIGYIGYGVSTQGWGFFLSGSFQAMGIVSSPSAKSLLTHLVDSSQFGAVLGAIQMVDSIAGILSPILISGVYALTVKTRPEFVWYCCAALNCACVVLGFMIRPKRVVKGAE